MVGILGILVFALSVYLTAKIAKVLLANTIGTTTAYITRIFIIWIFVMMGLMVAVSAIGGLFGIL